MGTVVSLKCEEPLSAAKAIEIDVAYEIETKQDYDKARLDLYELGRIEKEIEASHEPAVKEAAAKHKNLVKMRDTAIKPYEDGIQEIKGRMLDFVLLHPEVTDGVQKNTKIKVTDIIELIKAVAAGDVPAEALIPNEKFILEKARGLKDNLGYPGIDVYEEKSIINRL